MRNDGVGVVYKVNVEQISREHLIQELFTTKKSKEQVQQTMNEKRLDQHTKVEL